MSEYSLFNEEWSKPIQLNHWTFFPKHLLKTGNLLVVGEWRIVGYVQPRGYGGQVWHFHRYDQDLYLPAGSSVDAGEKKLIELAGDDPYQVLVSDTPIPDFWNQCSRIVTAIDRGEVFSQEREEGDYGGYSSHKDAIWKHDRHGYFHWDYCLEDYPPTRDSEDEYHDNPPYEGEEVNIIQIDIREYLYALNHICPLMDWVRTEWTPAQRHYHEALAFGGKHPEDATLSS